MRLIKLLSTLVIGIASLAACEKGPVNPNGPGPKPDEGKTDTTEIATKAEYAKGADISWITQMEADGAKFYTLTGQNADCFEVIRDAGFNAIRLRVWVNPEEGWCGKEDVLEKAARAYNLGMKLIIDFHYSDSWADPGKQNPPAEWKNHTAEEMTAAVAAHTKEVLNALHDLGISVEWVQVGNEVNNGMLHPLGKVQDKTAANFVKFLNAGYQAVKDVYPSAKVVLHVSNGHEYGLFDWFFSLMKDNNAKYDIIGMSLYPVWWENGGWSKWQTPVDACIANIKALNAKFSKPVMICEFGMPVSEPEAAKAAIQHLLDKTKEIEGCLGLFYWEPQTDGVWKPASYTSLGWNAYNMGAFKNGRPTVALDPFTPNNQTI